MTGAGLSEPAGDPTGRKSCPLIGSGAGTTRLPLPPGAVAVAVPDAGDVSAGLGTDTAVSWGSAARSSTKTGVPRRVAFSNTEPA